MADFKAEINEYVKKNGTGAHVEKDESGNIKIIKDNSNIWCELAEKLFKHRKEIVYFALTDKEEDRRYYNNDYESLFDLSFLEIMSGYDETQGMSFFNYLIQNLRWTFLGETRTDYRKLDGKEVSVNEALFYESDEGEDVPIPVVDDSVDRAIEYVEDSLDFSELFVNVCDIIETRAKTKYRMYRIFFTQMIIGWCSFSQVASDIKKISLGHENKIFEVLDGVLLDYIQKKPSKSFKDIIYNIIRTYFEINEFMDKKGYHDNVVETYKKAVNYDSYAEERKNSPIDVPLDNKIILAYLYYADVSGNIESQDSIKPHPSSYITKYMDEFKELMKQFFNPDVWERYEKGVLREE